MASSSMKSLCPDLSCNYSNRNGAFSTSHMGIKYFIMLSAVNQSDMEFTDCSSRTSTNSHLLCCISRVNTKCLGYYNDKVQPQRLIQKVTSFSVDVHITTFLIKRELYFFS